MNKLWSSLVGRLSPYVPGEQPQDQQYIKLNTNENPYPPSPKVKQALVSMNTDHLRLYPDPTALRLRQTLATQYDVDVQSVFVGNGSDEVLAFAFMAFFTGKNLVQYPKVSYSFYPVYCNLFGINAETIPLRDDFSIELNDYSKNAGGIIFPSPNAPTGMPIGLGDIESLLKRNPETVVIVDEAYIDFGGESAITLTKTYANLLVIQTFSKSRSLAGMRIGYAIGDSQLIEALVRVKDSFNSYPLDQFAQVAGIAAVEDDEYLKVTCGKIIASREKTIEALNDLGFRVVPSQANFVFAEHPDVVAEELYLTLKQKGILVRYFSTPGIDNFLRITIGTDNEMQNFLTNLPEVLERLASNALGS